MDNVLEHLSNPLKVVEELHRICKSGAKVYIEVPYFRSFYAAKDPPPVNFFSVWRFDYFDLSHPFHAKYQYSKAQFKVDKTKFNRKWKTDNGVNFLKKFHKICKKTSRLL